MAWMRTKLIIPKTIKPSKRVAIAQAVITHIQDRTFAGLDKNNNPFPKYTKEYAEFKGSQDVDLLLSGEMMDSIQLLSHSSGEINIGFNKSNNALNGKAEGNIKGSYGGEPNKKKARDFLGIDPDELGVIVSLFEDNSEESISEDEVKAITDELISQLLDDL